MSNIDINGGRIGLQGELSIHTVPGLFRLHADFAEPIRIIDLSGIENVDSSGLALLVYWHARLAGTPGFAGFENCPERLLDIARLVGLETIFAA
ncbi:MAG: STAS domain-containing protein [Gammaproteobacteria bacterium]|nr:STAS domain-containing protein [Gammaproteobacteria bacterium]